MRVLVAEDDAVSRSFLTRSLTNLGHEVEACKDGEEAWLCLQKANAPRLVILDWMMPGLSGPDVCANLRACSFASYTYIILLTSRHERGDIVTGLQSGADDYLIKPIGQAELEARLLTAQRILRLETRLQQKIKDLESMLHRYAQLADIASAQSSIEAQPDGGAVMNMHFSTRLAPIMGEVNEIVCGSLGESGLPDAPEADADDAADNTPYEPDFTAYSGIVFRAEEAWVDLLLETDRASAEALCKGMTGGAPGSDEEILDVLGKTLKAIQRAMRDAFAASGITVLLPLTPKAMASDVFPTGSAPGSICGRHVCDVPNRRLRLKFIERLTNVTAKPIGQLKELDVLADALCSPTNRAAVFLAEGLALNERYIQKLRKLIAAKHVDVKTLPVVEPSPLARAVFDPR